MTPTHRTCTPCSLLAFRTGQLELRRQVKTRLILMLRPLFYSDTLSEFHHAKMVTTCLKPLMAPAADNMPDPMGQT
eukprot:scaffold17764_cov33-Tisochrysis_lutea.AAC.4